MIRQHIQSAQWKPARKLSARLITVLIIAGTPMTAALQTQNWDIEPRQLPLPAAASDILREAIGAMPQPDVAKSRERGPRSEADWHAAIKNRQANPRFTKEQLESSQAVTITADTVAGVKVYHVYPAQVDALRQDNLFLYLHGGAYVFNGGLDGVYEAAIIANRAGIPVLAVDYRMPPDHPFPAALEDVVAVYQHLLKQRSASTIAMGGTSAGGGLSLAAVQQSIALNLPPPGALYLGTPWADLSKTGDTLFTHEGIDRVLVTYDGTISAAAQLYAGQHDLKHPLISPVYGDFKGFPPAYLVSGTRDMLLSDTVRVHRKLREAGAVADLNVLEGMSHAEYAAVPTSPESVQMYSELASFLGTHLESSAETPLAKVMTPSPQSAHPSRVFWGDTHLHTNRSVDANGMGDKNLSAGDAYRFARGEAITAHNGMEAQLDRPLDFIVVADHAVNLGVMPAIRTQDPRVMATEVGKAWAPLEQQYGAKAELALGARTREIFDRLVSNIGVNASPGSFFWRSWAGEVVTDVPFRRSVWEDVCAEAEKYNAPGEFTAFIGFEWTPSAASERSPNFHRNVVFQDGADKACQVLPFSVHDSENVEDLWAYLAGYEHKTGGKVLAIPHNGNLSSGKMFKMEDYDGAPIDAEYSTDRARWEPLYEMTQIKGDAEAHPVLSPDDQFADYETWHLQGFFGELPEDFAEQKKYEYARPALKLGLSAQASLGVNPFKFGMIGATDSHTSLSTAEEANFWGKLSMFEPSPYRAERAWQYSASGHAAVWAEENTRESLFAAMQRKEVYATTGTRITVRFFGGWDYAPDDAGRPDFADLGYQLGVPMGGDLAKGPDGGAPVFLIVAAKDPDGANLDRVQVIKGWISADGREHERVYDVAVSDARVIPVDGSDVVEVGSTVNLDDASYVNSIGEPQLSSVWQDPAFDASQEAFYYVRVIEIPTPRWTAYDVVQFGLKDEIAAYKEARRFGPEGTPQEIPMIVQERAYTSPIWYTPAH